MLLFHYEDDEILLGHMLDSDASDLDFPMHIHDNYELYCFVSGDAHYTVEGRVWKLEYGNTLLMRPGESHRIIIDSSKPYERYTLNFSDAALPEEFKGLLTNLEKKFPEEKTFFALSDFGAVTPLDLFVSACSGDYENPDLHIRALLPAFLSLLCTGYKNEINPHDSRSEGAKMVDWVNKHLSERITLEALSNRFHRSISQTQRIFYAATGTTFGKYCKTKRLLQARRMISEGKSAESACFECGFNDYSAFFRLYKKQFGYSPANTDKNILINTENI